MSELAVRVKPTSRKALRAKACRLRQQLGVKDDYFPIVDLLDPILSHQFPQYVFDVLPTEAMHPEEHALTDPDQRVILIREDTYIGACEGVGRDRFTLAHELGHLVLHGGNYLARTVAPRQQKPTHQKFEDSEWQADNFAAELLMPISAVKQCRNADELASRCGVSVPAAEVRFRVLRSEGAI